MAQPIPVADFEISLMEAAYRVLIHLDPAARQRALTYLGSRLVVPPPAASPEPICESAPEADRVVQIGEWERRRQRAERVGARVLTAVSNAADCSALALKGPSRRQSLTHPRFAAMLAMERAGLSYLAIGRVLNRDHTTIIHGVRRGRRLETESPRFVAVLNAAQSAIEMAA